MCLKHLFKKPEPPKPFEYGNNCLLHASINDYPGTGSDLNGCNNDQEDFINYADGRIGGISFRYLQDSEATPSAFEREIRAAYKAMPYGLLTVCYSGHGTYEKDSSEPDGYSEALYMWGGKFTDDRLIALANEKPAGLDLVFILDCCFGRGMARDFGNPSFSVPRFLMTDPMPENYRITRSLTREPHDWLVISACAENQTAADAQFGGRYNGAFTYYAVRTLEKGITYRQWMERIWQNLPSRSFDQIPGIDGPERLFERKVFEPILF
jgi:hypothetical protein